MAWLNVVRLPSNLSTRIARPAGTAELPRFCSLLKRLDRSARTPLDGPPGCQWLA